MSEIVSERPLIDHRHHKRRRLLHYPSGITLVLPKHYSDITQCIVVQRVVGCAQAIGLQMPSNACHPSVHAIEHRDRKYPRMIYGGWGARWLGVCKHGGPNALLLTEIFSLKSLNTTCRQFGHTGRWSEEFRRRLKNPPEVGNSQSNGYSVEASLDDKFAIGRPSRN